MGTIYTQLVQYRTRRPYLGQCLDMDNKTELHRLPRTELGQSGETLLPAFPRNSQPPASKSCASTGFVVRSLASLVQMANTDLFWNTGALPVRSIQLETLYLLVANDHAYIQRNVTEPAV